MLLALLIAWLVLSVLVFLLLPVFLEERVVVAQRAAPLRAPVADDKEAAAAAFQEVTWDYNLGNIDAEEFRALEAQYRRRLEAGEAQDGPLDAQLEAEIGRARDALRARGEE